MNENSVQTTITLDEIVEGYASQHRLPESRYFMLTQLGIRGLRLFHRDSTGFPQTANLTVLANGTAVLPTNALNKISVGILNNRGEIASLSYDPLLTFLEDTNPNREDLPHTDTLINNSEAIIGFQELQGGLVPSLGYGQYGVGAQPNIGFYNIDWENRVMIFNRHFRYPTVIFVYMGLPCEGGNYLVHPFFQEALISYITWQDSVGNPKSNTAERRMNKADFDLQYRNARHASAPFDPSDIYNVVRQGMRLAVKV